MAHQSLPRERLPVLRASRRAPPQRLVHSIASRHLLHRPIRIVPLLQQLIAVLAVLVAPFAEGHAIPCPQRSTPPGAPSTERRRWTRSSNRCARPRQRLPSRGRGCHATHRHDRHRAEPDELVGRESRARGGVTRGGGKIWLKITTGAVDSPANSVTRPPGHPGRGEVFPPSTRRFTLARTFGRHVRDPGARGLVVRRPSRPAPPAPPLVPCSPAGVFTPVPTSPPIPP